MGKDIGVIKMSKGKTYEPQQARIEEFVIGEWRVSPDCNQLLHRRLGVARRLEPRLMQLFGLLAANPGQTLSRDWLSDALWPRVIVTENSLTRAVSALRKSLVADGCSGGVNIETVPKKGYRLVLAETASAANPAASRSRSRALSRALSRGKPRSLPWPAFAAPVLALAVIAGSWLFGNENAPLTPFPTASVTDFGQDFVPVSSAGLAGSRQEAPVLSADGGRYAYISHDATGSTVWLGELRGGGEAVAVYSSSLPLANLVWSPAGNALLFARQGAVTAEALYGGPGTMQRAVQLLQFDLDNWTLSSLTPEPEVAEPAPLPAEIDLT